MNFVCRLLELYKLHWESHFEEGLKREQFLKISYHKYSNLGRMLYSCHRIVGFLGEMFVESVFYNRFPIIP